jgi:hypothetical protein
MSRFNFLFTLCKNLWQSLASTVSPRMRSILNPKALILLLVLLAFNVTPSKAQVTSFWSAQKRIPNYLNNTEEPPYLIADRNHTVHAFNSQPLNLDDQQAQSAVVYREWTEDNGWTYSNDILYDADGNSLGVIGVAADQMDRVYLLVIKGGDVYYTQNSLANADNGATWPALVKIGSNVTGYGPGNEIISAIATSPDGNEIVVIYSGREGGNGLYYTQSQDGGGSWSEPYPIYLTGDPTVVVTDPKLVMGQSGVFHAVWTTFFQDGSAGTGYYANYDPVANSWSEPIELDVPGIRTPSIIEYQGKVIVTYYHANVNGDWWRESSDDGKTWSLPERISPRHIGTNGNVSLVVDSKNVLHAFFGERIDDNNHGIWHVTFTGSTWENLEAVVRGPQRREQTGGNGFDPRSARAVIVNGNLALVTWGTDGFAGTNGAWYSYKQLDAPELPMIVLGNPTVAPTTAALPIPEAVIALPTATIPAPSATTTGDLFKSEEYLQNPQIALIAGVLPVLLLLVGMLVFYYLMSRQK